jgi:gamma-glutamyltranspeptidase/glutathione hydrolase
MELQFDSLQYPYPSRREVIYGRNGMVCTSQSLAAQAGLDMLKQGGNAVDAALATAISLVILEPTSNGLGSDAFALVWMKDKLYGLNGSGFSPQALSRETLLAKGFSEMPQRGWETVTVPGAPGAWAELHQRFGRLPFQKLFEPALKYAEEGYAVMPTTAQLWKEAEQTFAKYRNEPAFSGLFPTFFPSGTAPRVGHIMTLPQQAKTLRRLAESGCQDFYKGEIAAAIDEFSTATGGYIRQDDLAAYAPQWVDPIHINYRGYDVWEIPPNGHGLVVLMALAIARGLDFAERDTLDTFHKQIEAMKLAFTDGRKYIADPRYMRTKLDYWLSEEYAAKRRALIKTQAVMPEPVDPNCGGTVYLCTADGEGNMVSYIQSNFMGFGSGIVIPGYGISLNNRGNNFSMDPKSDNCVAPRKKPYHTIIPGFLTKDGKPIGPFGVMGGFMQPQGQMQVMMNTIDFHLNPQAALDAPRWQWVGGRQIEVEPGVPQEIIRGLCDRGHTIIINPDRNEFGRGQIIWRDENGVLMGATEPRADGVVAAW